MKQLLFCLADVDNLALSMVLNALAADQGAEHLSCTATLTFSAY